MVLERTKLFYEAQEAILAFCTAAEEAEGGEMKNFCEGAQLLSERLAMFMQKFNRPTVQRPCRSCGEVVRITPFFDWVDCEKCGETHSR